MIGLAGVYFTLNQIGKPIENIGPGHLEAVIRYLRTWHEGTGGLPGAADWLDLVRNAVESTPIRCPKCHGEKFCVNGEGTPVKACPKCGGNGEVKP